jgi:prepilin-type N-terminal cleavage/methylation domain-containing protein
MTSRTGNKGFTLIEIMAATAVLSLGIVLVYEAFFVSLDALGYCHSYLQVASQLDEKIWSAQDNLQRLGASARIESGGSFENNHKAFNWNLSYYLIDEAENLYRIDSEMLWQEGKKNVSLSRNAYALYEEKE